MPLLSIRMGQFVVSSSIITMLGDPNLHEVVLRTRKLSSKQAEAEAGRQVTQFAEEFESVGPREMRNAK